MKIGRCRVLVLVLIIFHIALAVGQMRNRQQRFNGNNFFNNNNNNNNNNNQAWRRGRNNFGQQSNMGMNQMRPMNQFRNGVTNNAQSNRQQNQANMMNVLGGNTQQQQPINALRQNVDTNRFRTNLSGQNRLNQFNRNPNMLRNGQNQFGNQQPSTFNNNVPNPFNPMNRALVKTTRGNLAIRTTRPPIQQNPRFMNGFNQQNGRLQQHSLAQQNGMTQQQNNIDPQHGSDMSQQNGQNQQNGRFQGNNGINAANGRNQQNAFSVGNAISQRNRNGMFQARNLINQRNGLNQQSANRIDQRNNGMAQGLTGNTHPRNSRLQQNGLPQRTEVNMDQQNANVEHVRNGMAQRNGMVQQRGVSLQNDITQQNRMALQNGFLQQNNILAHNIMSQENEMTQQNGMGPQNVRGTQNDIAPQNDITPLNGMTRRNGMVPQNDMIEQNGIVNHNSMLPQNSMRLQNDLIPGNGMMDRNVMSLQNGMVPQNVVRQSFNKNEPALGGEQNSDLFQNQFNRRQNGNPIQQNKMTQENTNANLMTNTQTGELFNSHHEVNRFQGGLNEISQQATGIENSNTQSNNHQFMAREQQNNIQNNFQTKTQNGFDLKSNQAQTSNSLLNTERGFSSSHSNLNKNQNNFQNQNTLNEEGGSHREHNLGMAGEITGNIVMSKGQTGQSSLDHIGAIGQNGLGQSNPNDHLFAPEMPSQEFINGTNQSSYKANNGQEISGNRQMETIQQGSMSQSLKQLSNIGSNKLNGPTETFDTIGKKTQSNSKIQSSDNLHNVHLSTSVETNPVSNDPSLPISNNTIPIEPSKQEGLPVEKTNQKGSGSGETPPSLKSNINKSKKIKQTQLLEQTPIEVTVIDHAPIVEYQPQPQVYQEMYVPVHSQPIHYPNYVHAPYYDGYGILRSAELLHSDPNAPNDPRQVQKNTSNDSSTISRSQRLQDSSIYKSDIVNDGSSSSVASGPRRQETELSSSHHRSEVKSKTGRVKIPQSSSDIAGVKSQNSVQINSEPVADFVQPKYDTPTVDSHIPMNAYIKDANGNFVPYYKIWRERQASRPKTLVKAEPQKTGNIDGIKEGPSRNQLNIRKTEIPTKVSSLTAEKDIIKETRASVPQNASPDSSAYLVSNQNIPLQTNPIHPKPIVKMVQDTTTPPPLKITKTIFTTTSPPVVTVKAAAPNQFLEIPSDKNIPGRHDQYLHTTTIVPFNQPIKDIVTNINSNSPSVHGYFDARGYYVPGPRPDEAARGPTKFEGPGHGTQSISKAKADSQSHGVSAIPTTGVVNSNPAEMTSGQEGLASHHAQTAHGVASHHADHIPAHSGIQQHHGHHVDYPPPPGGPPNHEQVPPGQYQPPNGQYPPYDPATGYDPYAPPPHSARPAHNQGPYDPAMVDPYVDHYAQGMPSRGYYENPYSPQYHHGPHVDPYQNSHYQYQSPHFSDPNFLGIGHWDRNVPRDPRKRARPSSKSGMPRRPGFPPRPPSYPARPPPPGMVRNTGPGSAAFMKWMRNMDALGIDTMFEMPDSTDPTVPPTTAPPATIPPVKQGVPAVNPVYFKNEKAAAMVPPIEHRLQSHERSPQAPSLQSSPLDKNMKANPNAPNPSKLVELAKNMSQPNLKPTALKELLLSMTKWALSASEKITKIPYWFQQTTPTPVPTTTVTELPTTNYLSNFESTQPPKQKAKDVSFSMLASPDVLHKYFRQDKLPLVMNLFHTPPPPVQDTTVLIHTNNAPSIPSQQLDPNRKNHVSEPHLHSPEIRPQNDLQVRYHPTSHHHEKHPTDLPSNFNDFQGLSLPNESKINSAVHLPVQSQYKNSVTDAPVVSDNKASASDKTASIKYIDIPLDGQMDISSIIQKLMSMNKPELLKAQSDIASQYVETSANDLKTSVQKTQEAPHHQPIGSPQLDHLLQGKHDPPQTQLIRQGHEAGHQNKLSHPINVHSHVHRGLQKPSAASEVESSYMPSHGTSPDNLHKKTQPHPATHLAHYVHDTPAALSNHQSHQTGQSDVKKQSPYEAVSSFHSHPAETYSKPKGQLTFKDSPHYSSYSGEGTRASETGGHITPNHSAGNAQQMGPSGHSGAHHDTNLDSAIISPVKKVSSKTSQVKPEQRASSETIPHASGGITSIADINKRIAELMQQITMFNQASKGPASLTSELSSVSAVAHHPEGLIPSTIPHNAPVDPTSSNSNPSSADNAKIADIISEINNHRQEAERLGGDINRVGEHLILENSETPPSSNPVNENMENQLHNTHESHEGHNLPSRTIQRHPGGPPQYQFTNKPTAPNAVSANPKPDKPVVVWNDLQNNTVPSSKTLNAIRYEILKQSKSLWSTVKSKRAGVLKKTEILNQNATLLEKPYTLLEPSKIKSINSAILNQYILKALKNQTQQSVQTIPSLSSNPSSTSGHSNKKVLIKIPKLSHPLASSYIKNILEHGHFSIDKPGVAKHKPSPSSQFQIHVPNSDVSSSFQSLFQIVIPNSGVKATVESSTPYPMETTDSYTTTSQPEVITPIGEEGEETGMKKEAHPDFYNYYYYEDD